MAIADGLYEIRSALLESMALDIAGGSTAKGANVQIYANNDTNAQKYRITEETAGHWSIVTFARLAAPMTAPISMRFAR